MSYFDLWSADVRRDIAVSSTLTAEDLRRFAWDLYHKPYCVLYTEDGKVKECVTCGEVRP